jgi:hypothetical protein
MLVLTVFSKVAYSQCELEKAQVDRWNKTLKNKVTERARNKHREAKKEFLSCLRQSVNAAPKKSSTSSNTKVRKTTKTKYQFAPRKSASHVTVSDYSNFKGKKKLAWSHYFKESEQCLDNKNDMTIFVACAKVRKQNLKIFNARWNDQTLELMPLLDN